ncbi:hypothetical protein Z946_1298 [Sulfitobacter noctilucicola]|uniref:DUF4440 domain-containing protein n=1 Tax=Sulfitobacter noctilucicola TaxID=1342301 RepID=A0A7W6M6J6_9RHOB|nr:nuclear transport factor 2 family protein [Sulfitobacter noctilucicola]KIN62440.1 hypothetical protein Z946_1298 [Sulfitobacter noctilucicola]MBB4173028.1 hypothetical protein [Sulfitobacter noctilucicola]
MNTPKPDDPLFRTIADHERQVWDALVSGDAATDATLLDELFLGVYSDGFAVKADHIGQLKHGPTIATYDLQDMRLMTLGSDHALISYRAVFQRLKRATPETMYVSSVWQRRDESWVNIFSQDTPEKK